MNGRDMLAHSENERLDLIKNIQDQRGAHLLCYLTSTRPGMSAPISSGDIEILEKHIRIFKAKEDPNKPTPIDLLLYTYGGYTVAPWNFIAMLRDYFPKQKFSVILPAATYSAGTMITLGADEVIAGPSTQLGPIDTSSGWESPYWRDGRNSASALQGYFDLAEEKLGLSRKAMENELLGWLSKQADGFALGEAYRMLRENRRMSRKIMESRSKKASPQTIDKVLNYFLYEVGLHGQAIRRHEAQNSAGLDTIVPIEKTGIGQHVVQLFNHYADIMKLNSPFIRSNTKARYQGDPADYDIYGEHASETPIVMIESEEATNAAYSAYRFRHWDDVPPLPGEGDKRKKQTDPQEADAPSFKFSWDEADRFSRPQRPSKR